MAGLGLCGVQEILTDFTGPGFFPEKMTLCHWNGPNETPQARVVGILVRAVDAKLIWSGNKLATLCFAAICLGLVIGCSPLAICGQSSVSPNW